MVRYNGPIFDCDTHLYETDDAWIRHLPARYHKDWLVHWRDEGEGKKNLYIGDRRSAISDGYNFSDGSVPAPGKLHEWLKATAAGKENIDFRVQPTPDMHEPAARLRKMDEFGVEACILFIGHMVSMISYFDQPDASHAAFHAYNQWLHEQWGFNYKDRIFATPLLHLADLERAVKEAEWVVKQGARVVVMPTGPAAYGKPATHPDYDRFWAVLNEAGVKVSYHVSEAIYMRDHMAVWGEGMQQPRARATAFFWMHGYGERPVIETMSSFIFHNFFARFPNIKLLSAENGCEWVPNMLVKMDKCRGMARNSYWPCGQLKQRPSEIFKQNCKVVAYPEDDLKNMYDQTGSTDWIVMGSDYPHSEGVTEPRVFADEACGGLSDEDTRRIMYDNGRAFIYS